MLANILYSVRRARWSVRERLRLLQPFSGYVLLTLEGSYPQLPPPNIAWWRRRLMGQPPADLTSWCEQMRLIAADPHIRGVVLRLSVLQVPIARLEVMHRAIQAVRRSGKRVIVWASHFELGNYWLASAADEILLQPGGGIGPLGLRQEYTFLGAALQRVGVGVDFVQSSPYKTAYDTFTRSSMSEAMREMGEWLLDSTYDGIVHDVARGRGVSEERVKAWFDRSPYTDEEALEEGLIDGILSEEELPEHLQEERRRPLRHLVEVRKGLPTPPPRRPGRYIALLRLTGTIVDGRSQQPPLRLPVPFLFDERAGDLSLVAQIRRLHADRRAAAVVLYIDSPGGSATASEAIAAAIARLAATKPVVVAMGSVAASGGYYVASQANWIVAHAHTVTGSIGVLSGKWVNRGLLERLMIHRESLYRGESALLYDPSAPFTDAEREEVARRMRRTYEVFLQRVATGRGLHVEAVDAVGGGRVWTGVQALERGLVDQIGGLSDAIEKACELARVSVGSDRIAVREIVAALPRAPVSTPADVPRQAIEYVTEGLQRLAYPRLLTLAPFVVRSAEAALVEKIL